MPQSGTILSPCEVLRWIPDLRAVSLCATVPVRERCPCSEYARPMRATTRHTAALRWRNGNRMMTPMISARADVW